MLDPSSFDELAHGKPYTVRGSSLDKLREMLESIPGAPHLRFGDRAGVVLLPDSAQEMTGEERRLEKACARVIGGISDLRMKGRSLTGLHELRNVLLELELAVDSLECDLIVDYRLKNPLPQAVGSAPRCVVCGSRDGLTVVSARCEPSDGQLETRANFDMYGSTYLEQVACEACESVYPLAVLAGLETASRVARSDVSTVEQTDSVDPLLAAAGGPT